MKICTEIVSLEQLSEEFAVPSTVMQGDDVPDLLWCYAETIADTNNLDQKVSVTDYLDLLAQEYKNPKLFIFSITSKEDRFEEWLDVAYGTIGATVCEFDRGSYTCYLCCVPSHFPQE